MSHDISECLVYVSEHVGLSIRANTHVHISPVYNLRDRPQISMRAATTVFGYKWMITLLITSGFSVLLPDDSSRQWLLLLPMVDNHVVWLHVRTTFEIYCTQGRTTGGS